MPLSSVVMQVTVVVPIGNCDPEGGVQTGAGGGLQVLERVGGEYSTIAPLGLVHSTVTSPGHVRVGGVSSTTQTN